MKSQSQAAKPQNLAHSRGRALIDFLHDVALEKCNATLEEVIAAQKELDTLLPDAEGASASAAPG
jgi:hypothetical protein